MGWFDEQIRERKQYDDEAFSEAFANMASAVMGKRISAAVSDDRRAAKDAIDDILKHYHIKSREIPDSISDVNEQLEYLLRPYGIMRRTVRLEDGWYRDAIGAMLGFFRESGKAVALIPGGLSGYTYFDPETGRRKRIDRKNQHLFGEEAIVFYKPFPLKKLSLSALAGYIVRTLSASDYVMIALATLALSLMGMLSPMISQLLFARVLPSGSVRLLVAMAVFSVCVSVSVLLVTAVKDMIQARIETKLSISVDAASMMRIMSLPADFFKPYSAGELAERASQIPVFPYIHIADIRLCPGAGSARAGHYPGDRCVLPAVHLRSDEGKLPADGAFRQGERHDLCPHLRHTEDQAGRGGEARLCPVGQPLYRERPADL